MRIIIRCAGEGTRWNNFMGVPKHLVELCGEPVLHRTLRLCNKIAPSASVHVIVRDPHDLRYHSPYASVHEDDPWPELGDVDKIFSSRRLWDPTDRTVTIWGDIWWHEDTLTDVLTRHVEDWHTWFRIAGEGGELFGFVHSADFNYRMEQAAIQVGEMHQAGHLDGAGYNQRSVRGGWALYRVLTGARIDDHGDHGHATLVDDGWTEDMDSYRDWDEWCARWAEADPAHRPPLYEGSTP